MQVEGLTQHRDALEVRLNAAVSEAQVWRVVMTCMGLIPINSHLLFPTCCVPSSIGLPLLSFGITPSPLRHTSTLPSTLRPSIISSMVWPRITYGTLKRPRRQRNRCGR